MKTKDIDTLAEQLLDTLFVWVEDSETTGHYEPRVAGAILGELTVKIEETV